MKNAYIISEGTRLTPVMTHSDAVQRLDEIKHIYPHAEIINTDEQVKGKRKPITTKPEEVEDAGCAGGGCTL